MLQEALKRVLSETEIRELYGAYDTIGDIVVLKISDTLMHRKHCIAEAILQQVKAAKTVLRQSTPVEGDYRVRGVEWIGGEEKTETLYKEHGCVFKVDLSKVYFSPRLSTERLRVARQVTLGECVVNMFGGVGTFSIIIAKKQIDSENYSVDINADAHQLAIENVKINKVTGRVTPICGNAQDIVRGPLRGIADRVLMPLPEKAMDFLEDAFIALRPQGGIVHWYTHVHASKKIEAIKNAERFLKDRLERLHQILYSRVVREVGPRWYQVVCDVRIGATALES